jgi:uncharacterized membrane protein
MLLVNGLRLAWLLFGGALTIILWTGLTVSFVLADRALHHSGYYRSSPGLSGKTPEILGECYTPGEFSRDEFETARETVATQVRA